MQLPDFIKRALAFFDKAEQNLTAQNALAQAEAKAKESADAHQKAIEAKDSEIDKLNDAINKASQDKAELEKQIADLKGQVTAAKNEANKVLASQGIRIEDVPATGASTNPDKETPRAKYHRLISEGKSLEAAAYYRDNREKVLTAE